MVVAYTGGGGESAASLSLQCSEGHGRPAATRPLAAPMPATPARGRFGTHGGHSLRGHGIAAHAVVLVVVRGVGGAVVVVLPCRVHALSLGVPVCTEGPTGVQESVSCT
jgi:hypothetical protein